MVVDRVAASLRGTVRGEWCIPVVKLATTLLPFFNVLFPLSYHLFIYGTCVSMSFSSHWLELGGSNLKECQRKFLQQASLLGKALQDARRYCWRVEDNGDHN